MAASKDYFDCERCGRKVARKSSTHKYCTSCKLEVRRVYKLEYTRQWRREHPTYAVEHQREWRKENPELVGAWKRENPEKNRMHRHNRRARIEGNGGSYTTEELHDLWHKQNGFCFYCGELLYKTLNSVYHTEHMNPLSRGGSNDISNIVLSCADCNLRKGTKTHEEFIQIQAKPI
jgi:5-methylcytosine-specific restriction endonuclease McrA